MPASSRLLTLFHRPSHGAVSGLAAPATHAGCPPRLLSSLSFCLATTAPDCRFAQQRSLHSAILGLTWTQGQAHLVTRDRRFTFRNSSTSATAATSATAPQPTPPAPTSQETSSGSKQVDARAPREEYQLTFTCKECSHRSTHKVSKQAYHGGTSLAQCPQCKVRHLISDHLGIFSDKKVTLEDIMKEKGEVIKKGKAEWRIAEGQAGDGVVEIEPASGDSKAQTS